MSEWTKEAGPACYCGGPTWVEPGEPPLLICLFHTNGAGASFPLPTERPDAWPNLSREELHTCMVKGADEEEARDGSE
jgi:hypothetical protein